MTTAKFVYHLTMSEFRGDIGQEVQTAKPLQRFWFKSADDLERHQLDVYQKYDGTLGQQSVRFDFHENGNPDGT